VVLNNILESKSEKSEGLKQGRLLWYTIFLDVDRIDWIFEYRKAKDISRLCASCRDHHTGI